MNLDFEYPWLLICLPFAFIFLKTPQAKAIVYSSVEPWRKTKPTWRIKLLKAVPKLITLIAILLIITMASPRLGSSKTNQKIDGIAISILMDISSSMEIEINGKDGDNKKRIEVAKEVLTSFILGDGEELSGRSSDLIGLITFARFTDTISPFTLGHNALTQIIQDLTVQERPYEDGTAYGDALALGCAQLKQLEANYSSQEMELDKNGIKNKIIILLTDGENNCGRHLPIESAALALKWGYRVYVISLGDKLETKTEDISGIKVQSTEEMSAADQLLESIAKNTGGIFRQAHDYSSLVEVYKEIDKMEKSRYQTMSLTTFRHIFLWFLIPALLLTFFIAIIKSTLLFSTTED